MLEKRKLGIYKTNFEVRYCKDCEKQLSFTNASGYCSKCYARHKVKIPGYIEKLKNAQLKRIEEGLHKGWNSRNIKSYAELFFEKVLDNNKINYIREKRVGKYFLDFVIGNIDLEIDGKQHKLKDRKLSDLNRDIFLKDNGYFVYRIGWNEINTDYGKQLMKNKIDLFLDFLDFFKSETRRFESCYLDKF